MGARDPRVGAYIANSAAFARPILRHLRRVVHLGCPDARETMKWGFPHFEHRGLLCSMASFRQHCAFSFWKWKLLEGPGRNALRPRRGAMGQFGRITAVADLPGERALIQLVRRAAALNEQGVRRPVRRSARGDRTLLIPADLLAALRTNPTALATFQGFSDTHRKEYVEWVTGARRVETRRRRVATALAWLSLGRPRGGRYARR